MVCHTSFSLFKVNTKLIYHVFLTILCKYRIFCFLILFSALHSNELDSFWHPQSVISSEKYTLFAKDVDDVVYQKTTLFDAFCVCGCVASHVESDPRGFILYDVSILTCRNTGLTLCLYEM